jgi:hypothetical protein
MVFHAAAGGNSLGGRGDRAGALPLLYWVLSSIGRSISKRSAKAISARDAWPVPLGPPSRSAGDGRFLALGLIAANAFILGMSLVFR